MKGDYVARRSSFGSSILKKRLSVSDITNSFPQHNSPAIVKTFHPDSSLDKDLMDNLTKENWALVKLIQDKNKIIETKGTELGMHRINLQKMQLQNWNLSQVNNQMLAELNLGKRKMKSLQHELFCKEPLLKAKNKALKKVEVIPADMKADNENGELTNHSRCNGLPRSRSISLAISTHQGAVKDATENKRRCLRRQSTNSESQHQIETIGNLLKIEITNISPAASKLLNIPNAAEKDGFGSENQQPERNSIGRPMRRAAEKVQSYKETPLNLKMRRK